MRADAERNRRRLIEVGRQVLLDLGGDAPLDAIARRADVGIGTLYRHFPNRAALLRAIAEDVLVRTAAAGRAALAEEPTAFDALRRFMHELLDIGVAVMNRIHSGFHPDPEFQALANAGAAAQQAIVERAQREGSLRRDVAFGDIGMVIVRFSRPIAGGFDPERELSTAHRQLDIYIDGLRSAAATGLPPAPFLSLEQLRARVDQPAPPDG